jgi:hypothetical protein
VKPVRHSQGYAHVGGSFNGLQGFYNILYFLETLISKSALAWWSFRRFSGFPREIMGTSITGSMGLRGGVGVPMLVHYYFSGVGYVSLSEAPYNFF